MYREFTCSVTPENVLHKLSLFVSCNLFDTNILTAIDSHRASEMLGNLYFLALNDFEFLSETSSNILDFYSK